MAALFDREPAPSFNTNNENNNQYNSNNDNNQEHNNDNETTNSNVNLHVDEDVRDRGGDGSAGRNL